MTKHAAICQSDDFWAAADWTTYDGTVITSTTGRDAYYYCKYTDINTYLTAKRRALSEPEVCEIIGPWASDHAAVDTGTWGTFGSVNLTFATVGVARHLGYYPTGDQFRIKTNAGGVAFMINSSQVIVDGLPIWQDATSYFCCCFGLYEYRMNITVKNCVSKGGFFGFRAYTTASGFGNYIFENCLATGAYNSGFIVDGAIYQWSTVVNCTAYGNNIQNDGYGGGYRQYGSGGGYTKYINCIGIGNTGRDWSHSGSHTQEDCISSDTSVSTGGTNCYPSKTAAQCFTNAAGGDFTLPSNSFARDIGIKVTGITPIRDILNVNRDETQDIGAFEYDTDFIIYPDPGGGLEINNLEAGSQIVVYETGTTTEITRDDNSDGSFVWYSFQDSIEVDYTIQKAGFIPQRYTGVLLTSVQISNGMQLVDRAYAASSGLTFASTATVNTGTKVFGLTAVSTGKNWYSFLIESWLSESSLRNVDFPVLHDGDESFTLISGWEFSTTNWLNLRRCGVRYLSISDVLTATYAGLLSIGDIGSNTAQIQQSDGGNQVAASASGDVDQLIQIYGDSTHGNFDRTGHLVAKVQLNGYATPSYDIIADGGVSALSDKLYSFPLNLISNGLTIGDPGITDITITDHGASPVTWNGKQFSITITDAESNSGTNIARWINYNLAQGGAFQGKAAFNWHDLIQANGDGFKTIRGPVYGDTGASLKGVRVLRDTDAHPDFNLFTSDDGTTYAPPITASVTITNAHTGSLVQLFDTVSNTELYIGTGPYYWSEEYNVDRTIRMRIMYSDATTAKIFKEEIIGDITEQDSKITYRVSQSDDNVYNSNSIDGSSVIGITINDSVMLINIDSSSASLPEIYAYETYWLSTEDGIRDETRIITAVDTANYIFSNFKIKNISVGPLVISGGYMVDADTNTALAIIDTSGETVFLAPDHVVPYAAGNEATVATVQAGLTAQGYTGTRAGKIDYLTDSVAANITKVNGVGITGNGSSTPWGPA